MYTVLLQICLKYTRILTLQEVILVSTYLDSHGKWFLSILLSFYNVPGYKYYSFLMLIKLFFNAGNNNKMYMYNYTHITFIFIYPVSSPAEKAYEVAAGSADGLESQDQLGLVGKDNSIFVAALKEHLQAERGSLKDTVQSLFNATAKSM